ncbi:hypothetical protein CLV59_109275 [Chitinophaga dinghuensis]|uniref:DUF4397 domain-containing protein n=1 Tax=Chitinophaga dinghuensis TaxID=1539050 RepID=A0A327VWV2_9BACT|nr:hypothetical protein [Chitinophaga dinghuensis]RAJ75661.1 hypothetical protein CLV59_109275 [Chitinophaga dinghuensis]
MYLKKLVVIALLSLSIAACRKGELPDEKYFGSVSYSVAQLPGTPIIDVKFNGVLIDSITNAQTKSTIMQAGLPGKLSFYKAGSDTLIADTAITILPNKTMDFRIISSATLGVNGILTPASVSPDSLTIQIYLNLSSYYKYDVVDLQLQYVGTPATTQVDVALLKGVKNKQLYSTVLQLLHKNKSTNRAYQYLLTLKDPATGLTIPTPRTPSYFLFASPTYAGNYISYVSDNNGTLSSKLTGL